MHALEEVHSKKLLQIIYGPLQFTIAALCHFCYLLLKSAQSYVNLALYTAAIVRD